MRSGPDSQASKIIEIIESVTYKPAKYNTGPALNAPG
jgi:hypothetical protein